ncbi:MAG: serine/threonine protein kinase, partial [Bryobacteraceae bacterium]
MQVAWAQWEGQIVDGRFPLRQYLGGSQHTAVFLTEYERPEPRPVPRNAAIKLFAAPSTDTELQLSQWKMAADLSHPNLIRIFEMGRSQLYSVELLYVVMEYAEENLAQVLRQRALTPAEAFDMLDPAVQALAYLHGKGFVHGRLKPANIMAVDDQLKVSSDGLYRAGERSTRPEGPSAYDAPEMDQGMSPAGDVWSLGVTLVEALTQHPPVQDRVPDTLPRPLADISRQSLERDPRLRWTVADVAARLREISQPAEAPKPSFKRRYITLGAILGVALALGVALRPKAVDRRPVEQPSAQPAPQRTPAASAVATPSTPSPGEVVHQVLPNVPARARNGIQGTVRVRVRARVDSSGNV